jgi:hypothetical protein
MSVTALTCADVESRDLEARYVAGRLGAAEAADYEAHYFGCDTCWPSLQRATELRAAFAVTDARPPRSARVWGFAAAAVLVIVVGAGVLERGAPVGIDSRGVVPGALPGAMRGGRDALIVRATADAGRTSVAWGAVPDADRYVVRLYRADGELVIERETADTLFAISADSIALTARADTLYWQVLALDRLRQSLARSSLTAAPPRAAP